MMMLLNTWGVVCGRKEIDVWMRAARSRDADAG